jgi:UDP-2-acetamido-3-amino-2,3-dideoxy-glucuronate N-acetyltransferase
MGTRAGGFEGGIMSADSAVFIHPKALVETDSIGPGTRVWAFAHVMAGATVGARCNVGDHCFIESGVSIGDDVTVKNGVSIWQHVHIADCVFVGPAAVFTNDRFPRKPNDDFEAEETWVEHGATIGANATIVCGRRIGRHAFVAAGAVVTRDVRPHALVMGNPARQKGWVCACARRLPDAIDDVVTCKRCSARYLASPDGIVALS